MPEPKSGALPIWLVPISEPPVGFTHVNVVVIDARLAAVAALRAAGELAEPAHPLELCFVTAMACHFPLLRAAYPSRTDHLPLTGRALWPDELRRHRVPGRSRTCMTSRPQRPQRCASPIPPRAHVHACHDTGLFTCIPVTALSRTSRPSLEPPADTDSASSPLRKARSAIELRRQAAATLESRYGCLRSPAAAMAGHALAGRHHTSLPALASNQDTLGSEPSGSASSPSRQ